MSKSMSNIQKKLNLIMEGATRDSIEYIQATLNESDENFSDQHFTKQHLDHIRQHGFADQSSKHKTNRYLTYAHLSIAKHLQTGKDIHGRELDSASRESHQKYGEFISQARQHVADAKIDPHHGFDMNK